MARHLIISDLQIPFEAKNALAFCIYLKRHYKIPDENVYCVGDEVDQYFGSQYKKDPNALLNPLSEIQITIEKMRKWYKAFPKMKLAISNHGMRWAKKASDAEIPSQMVRAYQEVIQAPKGWVWRSEWVVKGIHPFRVIHGLGYSGHQGHRTAAIDSGMSTVIGHLHSNAGISVIRTSKMAIWGMNSGCLIDLDSFAFSYGQDSRFKPCLGTSVVLDGGKTPIWIPYE